MSDTCIVSACDPNYLMMAGITSSNHVEYARANNYHYDHVLVWDGHPSWAKIEIMANKLEKYRWVVWIDCDAIFLDPRPIPFASGIQFSTDWNGLCCCFIIAHKSDEVIKLLRTVAFVGDVRDHSEFAVPENRWEQNTFKKLIKSFPKIDAMCHVLPHQLFADTRTNHPKAWIYHAGGVDPHHKMNLLRERRASVIIPS